MADNVQITPGAGNVVAADEITDGTLGQVKVQYIKLMDGTLDSTNKAVVDGTGDLQVDVNNFPATQTVVGSVSVSNFPATQPVSGTVAVSNLPATQPISAVSLPLPSGASTSALQTTGNSSLATIATNTTNAGTPVVSGTVAVNNFPASQAVTGTFFQATQPVSLTSTAVTGTVAVTESGTWTVQPGNTPNTVPWLVENRPSTAQSYGAAIIGLVPLAAGATDLFTITGSATKTVKVLALHIAGNATTAITVNLSIVKRSTADTGGTSTAPTRVPHDSTNAAATATVLAYTANPTALGASVGMLDAFKLDLPTSASATNGQLDENFDDGQPYILRGTGEMLAFNLNSTAIAGGNLNISVHWTEE